MALVNFDAETQADGVALIQGNSGGFFSGSSNVNASGNVTRYESDQFAHGARSIWTERTTGTTPAFMQRTLENAGREVIRMYFRFPVVPTGGKAGLFRVLNSSATIIASLFVNENGRVEFQDAAGIMRFETPAAISANTWYRAELAIGPGTSSTTGAYSLFVYQADNISAISGWSAQGTTMNFGTVPQVGFLRVGRFEGSSWVGGYYYDDVATSDQASGLIGPVGSAPPVAAGVGTDNVFTYNMKDHTTPSAPGNAMSYSIVKASGQTLTASEPVDGFFCFTKSVLGPAVYTGTALDTVSGQSDTVTINIPAAGGSGGLGNPRRWVGTPGTPSASWD